MTWLQFWFLAFVIGIMVMFSTVRVRKEESGAMVFFDIIIMHDNKKTVLGYIIMDIALIGLFITAALSLLPNWFYVLCLLSGLVVSWKGLYQLQRDAVEAYEAYLEEVREKRRARA